jgi:hypothetical protein
MNLVKKIHNRKTVWMTPDGKLGAYAFGKWWLVKNLATGQVVHKCNTLQDAKDYLDKEMAA